MDKSDKNHLPAQISPRYKNLYHIRERAVERTGWQNRLNQAWLIGLTGFTPSQLSGFGLVIAWSTFYLTNICSIQLSLYVNRVYGAKGLKAHRQNYLIVEPGALPPAVLLSFNPIHSRRV
jgi:hypothetical protein